MSVRRPLKNFYPSLSIVSLNVESIHSARAWLDSNTHLPLAQWLHWMALTMQSVMPWLYIWKIIILQMYGHIAFVPVVEKPKNIFKGRFYLFLLFSPRYTRSWNSVSNKSKHSYFLYKKSFSSQNWPCYIYPWNVIIHKGVVSSNHYLNSYTAIQNIWKDIFRKNLKHVVE